MTASEVFDLLVSMVQGAGIGAVFLLVLFIGFCLVLGYVKLRPSGPRTLTVRSLDEALGTRSSTSRRTRPAAPPTSSPGPAGPSDVSATFRRLLHPAPAPPAETSSARTS